MKIDIAGIDKSLLQYIPDTKVTFLRKINERIIIYEEIYRGYITIRNLITNKFTNFVIDDLIYIIFINNYLIMVYSEDDVNDYALLLFDLIKFELMANYGYLCAIDNIWGHNIFNNKVYLYIDDYTHIIDKDIITRHKNKYPMIKVTAKKAGIPFVNLDLATKFRI